jgi:hypothetical protein
MPRTADTPDTQAVKEALQLADPLGVLTVYLDAREAATPGSTALQSLEVELHRLARQVDASWTVDAAPAHAALDAFEQRVRGATLSGEARSLALFAALGHGKTVELELRGAVPTRATLGPRADVRPLCVSVDEARPAGVALVSAEGVRVLEWTPGALAEVWSDALPELEEPDLVGPARSHPRSRPETGPGFQAGQQRDLYEHRIRSELERLLAGAGGRVAELARARGWHEVALAGDERLTAELARGLPSGAPVEIAPVPRLEQWRSLGELASLVAPAIAGVRERRTVRLVEQVLEQAGPHGRGARGLREVLAALGEARVDTLLVVADAPVAGRSSPDGVLAAPGDTPPGATSADLVDDPMLADAMIARALDTGATIAVLSQAPAQLLEGDPVAALLRY